MKAIIEVEQKEGRKASIMTDKIVCIKDGVKNTEVYCLGKDEKGAALMLTVNMKYEDFMKMLQ